MPGIGGYEASQEANKRRKALEWEAEQRRELARKRRLRRLNTGFLCDTVLKSGDTSRNPWIIVDASNMEYHFLCCGQRHYMPFYIDDNSNVDVDYSYLKYLEHEESGAVGLVIANGNLLYSLGVYKPLFED